MMWLQTMSLHVMKAIQSARDREEGQGLVEYALILSLVSIASIAILGFVGTDVKDVLNTVEDALAGNDG
jgi:pilus assembly protein Flp/PilA